MFRFILNLKTLKSPQPDKWQHNSSKIRIYILLHLETCLDLKNIKKHLWMYVEKQQPVTASCWVTNSAGLQPCRKSGSLKRAVDKRGRRLGHKHRRMVFQTRGRLLKHLAVHMGVRSTNNNNYIIWDSTYSRHTGSWIDRTHLAVHNRWGGGVPLKTEGHISSQNT